MSRRADSRSFVVELLLPVVALCLLAPDAYALEAGVSQPFSLYLGVSIDPPADHSIVETTSASFGLFLGPVLARPGDFTTREALSTPFPLFLSPSLAQPDAFAVNAGAGAAFEINLGPAAYRFTGYGAGEGLSPPFSLDVPGDCGGAAVALDFIPGDGTEHTHPVDSWRVLGQSDGEALVLGTGGVVEVELDAAFADGDGYDLWVYENDDTLGALSEGFLVECRFVATDPWLQIGVSIGGSLAIDLQGSGLPGVKYLRITDDGIPDEGATEPNLGADIDAVVGRTCVPGPSWISGTVVDVSTLQGVGSMQVQLEDLEHGTTGFSAVTNGEGEFEVGPILGGSYRVRTAGVGWYHRSLIEPITIDCQAGLNALPDPLVVDPFHVEYPLAGDVLTRDDLVVWESISSQFGVTIGLQIELDEGQLPVEATIGSGSFWQVPLMLANSDEAKLSLRATKNGLEVGRTADVPIILAMPTTALLDENRRVFVWEHNPGTTQYRIIFTPDELSYCENAPIQPVEFIMEARVDAAGRAHWRAPGQEDPQGWALWAGMSPAEYIVTVETLAGAFREDYDLGRISRGRLHCPGGDCDAIISISRPLMLVHGWKESYQSCWVDDVEGEGNTTIPLLREESQNIFGLSYPPTGFAETAAGLLARALDALRPSLMAGQDWTLVGHSFGGLVSRAYLQGMAAMWEEAKGPCDESPLRLLPYRQDVASLVTLGTPHDGVAADATEFMSFFTDEFCNEEAYATRQMSSANVGGCEGIDPIPLLIPRLQDLQSWPWPDGVRALFVAGGMDWHVDPVGGSGYWAGDILRLGKETDGAVPVASGLAQKATSLTSAARVLVCGENHKTLKNLQRFDPSWSIVQSFLEGEFPASTPVAEHNSKCRRGNAWDSISRVLPVSKLEPTKASTAPLPGAMLRARTPVPGMMGRYFETVSVTDAAGSASLRLPSESVELEVSADGHAPVSFTVPPAPPGHTQTLEVVLEELPSDGRPRRPSIRIDETPYWLVGDSTTTVYPSCEGASEMRLVWGLLGGSPAWQPYATTLSLLAPTTAGPHALFAQFRSAVGDTSVWVSDVVRVPGDSTGTLRIFSNLAQGQVLLDGAIWDVEFPATFERLDAGEHVFDVLAPGHQSKADLSAMVEKDQTTITYVGLSPSSPPPDFSLLAPEQGGGIRSDEALLSWEPSIDPDLSSWMLYTVRAYEDSLATEPLRTWYVGGLTETDPPFAVADSTVGFWDVLARNSAGQTTASRGGVQWFFVDDTAPNLALSGPDSGRVYDWGQTDSLVVVAEDWSSELLAVALLSADGGQSFPDTLVAGPPGTLPWTPPRVLCDSCRIQVTVTDPAGNQSAALSEFFAIKAPTGIGDELPVRLALLRNHPNPFNPATVIPFELPRGGQVRIAIYDVRGRLVDVVEDGLRPRGRHTVIWHGTDRRGRSVASGVYLLRLDFEGDARTRKIALVR